jgi:hypothetical protein
LFLLKYNSDVGQTVLIEASFYIAEFGGPVNFPGLREADDGEGEEDLPRAS